MGFLPGVPETVGWYWDTWGLWANGTFTDPQTGLAKLDSPEFIRGYQWVRDFVDTFGQRDVLRFESSLANFNSPDNPFMKGRLTMAQQGPWFANMLRQYGPDVDYGVAPFPTADGSELSFCGQDVLTIPNGAHHPDQAWAFISNGCIAVRRWSCLPASRSHSSAMNIAWSKASGARCRPCVRLSGFAGITTRTGRCRIRLPRS